MGCLQRSPVSELCDGIVAAPSARMIKYFIVSLLCCCSGSNGLKQTSVCLSAFYQKAFTEAMCTRGKRGVAQQQGEGVSIR